ncbi:ribosomal-protein-alanine N-acetyltransferase [Clostridium cavendishii DSM 21758]|uniref:Ribosomal-protein-alanine N-acetyltransferase n=1 Tax=Clostridium cavendishii DSM 21758 TaxID=1121302 RepID=A0A1M6U7W3_9CLOT|nr:GNAT family protein [Clostridium cavendishii]SHK65365.1 ribosomal-protein-alanine N-acetyltransferase [Clostridium cavendishii DSM 21758]
MNSEKGNNIYELFLNQPILQVQEYKLRTVEGNDRFDILDIYINRRIEIYDRFPLLDNIDQVDQFIKILKEKNENKERVDWVIEVGGKAIGLIAIHSISVLDSRCEIGYILNQEYTNRGIMSKIVEFIIDYLFDQVKIHKIEAIVNTQNEASIKLCKKLGFLEEGIKKDYWFDNEKEKYISVYIFSIINNKKISLC